MMIEWVWERLGKINGIEELAFHGRGVRKIWGYPGINFFRGPSVQIFLVPHLISHFDWGAENKCWIDNQLHLGANQKQLEVVR